MHKSMKVMPVIFLSLLFFGGCGNSGSVELEETPSPTEVPEKEYSIDAFIDDRVYLDIVSIQPQYTFLKTDGSFTSIMTEPEHIACTCYTLDGRTEWVYMRVEDFQLDIDSDAHFYSNIGGDSQAKAVLPPRRIHGTAIKAESINYEMPEEIGYMLMAYEKMDPVSEQAEETAFSQSAAVGSPVYTEIKSLEPVYYTYSMFNGDTNLVCEGITDSGNSVYIYIEEDDYRAYIDADAEMPKGILYTGSLETTVFPKPVRINGWAMLTELMIPDDADKFGKELLYFKEIEGVEPVSVEEESE